MIEFINAKINIGLNILRRRSDGYHDLSTFFYPIGVHSGSCINPDPFCDILEIVPSYISSDDFVFSFSGRAVDCPESDNLVCRAARLFADELRSLPNVVNLFSIPESPLSLSISLDKHLPDGAGLGGGSADASFALSALNEYFNNPFSQDSLARMALSLGADCPFFIYNSPAFASGVGEKLSPSDITLKGYWLAVVKPPVYVSTREAFAGIKPRIPDVDLRQALRLPISDWHRYVVNDFECSIFPKYPVLQRVKESLYEADALYASMSGSGSSIYGIFESEDSARSAVDKATSLYDVNPSAFSSVLLL
ncbi:MAG: 4-(cytidine 5'-diphospho)-2-C-methyl-D-erythritol kinase [Clostridium sp.]|nr:4-(cytidine 5'-diphospho)-2-C-methyl-D-erythritol kinase [Prevotella sp.]MCM1429405.1 4-(cytidine 5'-diphospho)-2-C-methyl-D-erythritol kinase [Clostridium sp.]MCM1475560.1 4-(cytidine 5'-diphospho)-2-C-methyl-D-erythritol kinase [Muribaculaceae bacterium]